MYDSAKMMAALEAELARKMGEARRRVLSRTFGIEADHALGRHGLDRRVARRDALWEQHRSATQAVGH